MVDDRGPSVLPICIKHRELESFRSKDQISYVHATQRVGTNDNQ